jgi:hypothetical protein
MTSGIYAIVNKENGHRYVGSAIDIPSRWRVHRHHLNKNNHHSPHLQNAWNKYGEGNFEFIVLEECPTNLVLQREQEYLNSSPEYNTAKIAGSQYGFRFSEEQKKKASEVHTGFRHTEESKKKMSEIWKGKPRGKYSEERCKNISEGHKGYIPNENQLRGLEIGRNKPMTDEVKKKISDAQKGYQPTEETLDKLRQAWVRRKARMENIDQC